MAGSLLALALLALGSRGASGCRGGQLLDGAAVLDLAVAVERAGGPDRRRVGLRHRPVRKRSVRGGLAARPGPACDLLHGRGHMGGLAPGRFQVPGVRAGQSRSGVDGREMARHPPAVDHRAADGSPLQAVQGKGVSTASRPTTSTGGRTTRASRSRRPAADATTSGSQHGARARAVDRSEERHPTDPRTRALLRLLGR